MTLNQKQPAHGGSSFRIRLGSPLNYLWEVNSLLGGAGLLRLGLSGAGVGLTAVVDFFACFLAGEAAAAGLGLGVGFWA